MVPVVTLAKRAVALGGHIRFNQSELVAAVTPVAMVAAVALAKRAVALGGHIQFNQSESVAVVTSLFHTENNKNSVFFFDFLFIC